MSEDHGIVEEPAAAADERSGGDGAGTKKRGLPAEWRNFFLLSIILLLVVVVVAGSRPFIFERVIPAVLGENLTRATLQDDAEEPVKEEPEEGRDGDTGNLADDPADGDGGEEAPLSGDDGDSAPDGDGADTVQPGDFPTAVPARTHTVRRGENLTGIANLYGVTVEALVSANDLSNPNQVFAGDVLFIPEP